MNTVSQAYVERDGKLAAVGTPIYITAGNLEAVRRMLKWGWEEVNGEAPVLFVTKQIK